MRGTTKTKESNSNPDLIKLGKRIRELRIERGYRSAEKFAQAHNLSRTYYCRWEAGKRNITYRNLEALCKAFDISLSQFFAEGFD